MVVGNGDSCHSCYHDNPSVSPEEFLHGEKTVSASIVSPFIVKSLARRLDSLRDDCQFNRMPQRLLEIAVAAIKKRTIAGIVDTTESPDVLFLSYFFGRNE